MVISNFMMPVAGYLDPIVPVTGKLCLIPFTRMFEGKVVSSLLMEGIPSSVDVTDGSQSLLSVESISKKMLPIPNASALVVMFLSLSADAWHDTNDRGQLIRNMTLC